MRLASALGNGYKPVTLNSVCIPNVINHQEEISSPTAYAHFGLCLAFQDFKTPWWHLLKNCSSCMFKEAEHFAEEEVHEPTVR